jgi:MFS family permease
VGDFFSQIWQGYQFIKNTKRVLFSFGILLAIQIILVVLFTNLPPIATELVGISAKSSGVAVILPAGLGALIATFSMSRFLSKVRKRILILISLVALSIDMIVVISAVPLIANKVLRVGVAAVLFGVAGFCVVSILSPAITYLQEKTPRALLGRVFGNLWFLTTIVTIVPVVFGGTITEILGVQALLLVMALFGFFAFFVSSYKVKEI